MAKSPGVSIIICTYNGEDVIAKALEHLLQQKVDGFLKWEVLLINNNSSDDTVRIAEETWKNGVCTASFRIIDQPIPGKTKALEKGLRKACYEFVLICDDDNFLEENYVQMAYDIMLENPQVGFLGGRGYAKADTNFPDWFDDYKDYYGCGPQSLNGKDITHKKEYVYGAGSMFRKSIFDGLNEDVYFRALPGRKNNNHVGAEDNIMSYVAVIQGFKIWYCDRLKFYHKIRKDRLKWEYVLNLSYSTGRAQVHLGPYTDFIRNNIKSIGWGRKMIKNVRRILALIINLGFSITKEIEGNQCQVGFYYHLGVVHELMKINFSYKSEYQKSIQYCELAEKKGESISDFQD